MTMQPRHYIAMPQKALDHPPAGTEHIDLSVFAQALGLKEGVDLSSIVAAIEGFRVLQEAKTLEQVRERLYLPAYADAMYCAADLCRRLPPSYGTVVVAAMFRIEVKDRTRTACVTEIKAAALRSPCAPLDG